MLHLFCSPVLHRSLSHVAVNECTGKLKNKFVRGELHCSCGSLGCHQHGDGTHKYSLAASVLLEGGNGVLVTLDTQPSPVSHTPLPQGRCLFVAIKEKPYVTDLWSTTHMAAPQDTEVFFNLKNTF